MASRWLLGTPLKFHDCRLSSEYVVFQFWMVGESFKNISQMLDLLYIHIFCYINVCHTPLKNKKNKVLNKKSGVRDGTVNCRKWSRQSEFKS